MYTLRIIEETRENEKAPFEQVIENFWLGDSYSILKKGITKEFGDHMKKNHPKEKHDGIKALLCGVGGLEFFILDEAPNRRYSYFIMTESGKTFERL
jgi:hypothetical protein